MRLDHYSATLGEIPDRLIAAVQEGLGAADLEDRPGLHGYRNQVLFKVGDRVLARLCHGGNRGAWPLVWTGGEEAVGLSGFLRSKYPNHRVTRLDAAQDFDGPGTWDRLAAICTKHADAGGLKLHQHGDWHRLQDGRTIYVGSRKSAVFVRLYEKGKQLGADITGLDQGGVRGDIRADWCRLEVQVRPQGDARHKAATVTPEEVWGFSGWTARLLRAVDGSEVPRVNMQQRRIPDHEAAVLHMAKQYAASLEKLRAERGWSWEELGRKLGQLIEREQRQHAKQERDAA